MISGILLALFLVVLNGFFVAAEFALVKVRVSQIDLAIKNGNPFAKTSKHVVTHLDAYLSATQLGVTIASLGLGWVGESVIAHMVVNGFRFLGITADLKLVHAIATPTAFFLITVLHIVFGELAPKSIAIRHPVTTSYFVAAPLRVFYWVFSPFIFILNRFSNLVVRQVGLITSPHHDATHTPEEIDLLLDQSRQNGLVDAEDYDIIRNVLYASKKNVRQIMVPYPLVTAIDISESTEAVVNKAHQEGYSRLPVFRKNMDNIVGVLNVKDVLKHEHIHPDSNFDWREKIQKAHFVPETKNMMDLLKEFESHRVQMAIVSDEFGATAGVVTIEDVIEALIGKIHEENDDEEEAVTEKEPDREWTATGYATIEELNEILPEPISPSEYYETISGLLNFRLGRIPVPGDAIEEGPFHIEVLEASKRQTQLVKIRM